MFIASKSKKKYIILLSGSIFFFRQIYHEISHKRNVQAFCYINVTSNNQRTGSILKQLAWDQVDKEKPTNLNLIVLLSAFFFPFFPFQHLTINHNFTKKFNLSLKVFYCFYCLSAISIDVCWACEHIMNVSRWWTRFEAMATT